MLPDVRVGTDLVDVERLRRLLVGGPEVAARIFTDRELAYCAARPRRSEEHLAARFAAKEAVMKALGTGAAGMDWTDVEVVNDRSGRPRLNLRGRAALAAGNRRVRRTDVSLSHTAELAVAHVVLVCAAPETDPETAPGTSPVPDPETTPGTDPAPNPETTPGTAPVPDPGTGPGAHRLPRERSG
ncbi:holo-ACP synthase [Streptomyces sp. NPDC058757]|uniref:holo-ACP synthase n=1 Tax=Streptomyces sp. NPDC058757 TaxID=3346626 RepID=UPI0036745670